MTKRRWLWAASAVGLLLLAALGVPGIPAQAATLSFYTDRATFEAALVAMVTDHYDSPPYPAVWAIHSDAAFSAFLGETDYHSTGFENTNMRQDSGNYCAGCNGSFLLSFQTTSVTQSGAGVYGVGLDILANSSSLPYCHGQV